LDSIQNDFNLEDIARISGVSRSTVSRVINNHPNVSDRTRERVEEIIKRYNFQPNAAARALASQRSNVIGVMIPHIVSAVFSDPFFPLLLQSITSYASHSDYDVTLWLTSTEDNGNVLNRVLGNRLLDGLIVASAVVDDPVLEKLQERGKPFVLIGHPSARHYASANYIDVENEMGARLMTEYLIKRGHRRIAMIPGRQELPSNQDRLVGYANTLEEHGISADPNLVAPVGNFTEVGGYQSMKHLLSQDQNIDAVFCASDYMAYGAIRAIREAGLRIPEDIAVAGFDDMPGTESHHPPLTTVRQPIGQLGIKAAEILIGILEGDTSQPYQELLPVEVVIRESA
jgi:LacI family transcriptional regulator